MINEPAGREDDQPDPGSWDEYFPSKEKHMPDYFYPIPGGTVGMPPFNHMYGDFDWSPIDLQDEQTGDYQSASWVIDRLNEDRDRPFFLACGIYRPHLPWYVPQKYFDLFPLESVQLPSVLKDDLGDVGERSREIASRGGDYHRHVVEAGQWQAAVQGYLASIAYADPEEWSNLAGDPAYAAVKAELALHIPAAPAPLAETSYKVSPHHVPPWKSQEDYLEARRLFQR